MKLLGMLIRFISESGFQRNILAFGREEAMNDVQQRAERSVLRAYDEHAPMLYRIAFTYLKNQYDSEDALQECFLRYLRSSPSFSDPQHEKAWLIVTVGNICRDMLRSRSRRHESLEDHGGFISTTTKDTRWMRSHTCCINRPTRSRPGLPGPENC